MGLMKSRHEQEYAVGTCSVRISNYQQLSYFDSFTSINDDSSKKHRRKYV